MGNQCARGQANPDGMEALEAARKAPDIQEQSNDHLSIGAAGDNVEKDSSLSVQSAQTVEHDAAEPKRKSSVTRRKSTTKTKKTTRKKSQASVSEKKDNEIDDTTTNQKDEDNVPIDDVDGTKDSTQLLLERAEKNLGGLDLDNTDGKNDGQDEQPGFGPDQGKGSATSKSSTEGSGKKKSKKGAKSGNEAHVPLTSVESVGDDIDAAKAKNNYMGSTADSDKAAKANSPALKNAQATKQDQDASAPNQEADDMDFGGDNKSVHSMAFGDNESSKASPGKTPNDVYSNQVGGNSSEGTHLNDAKNRKRAQHNTMSQQQLPKMDLDGQRTNQYQQQQNTDADADADQGRLRVINDVAEDGSSQGSYMIRAGSERTIMGKAQAADTMSDASYMVRQQSGFKTGNVFDDVSSQGSVMFRGNQNDVQSVRFDDGQSDGSVFQMAGGQGKPGAPTPFDDASSAGGSVAFGKSIAGQSTMEMGKIERFPTDQISDQDSESDFQFGKNAGGQGDDMSARVQEVAESSEGSALHHGGPSQRSLYDDQVGTSTEGYQYDGDNDGRESGSKMIKSSTAQVLRPGNGLLSQ